MIHEFISKRFSTRAYSDHKINANLISDLFEAARWAPSSRNEQPWRFIYAEKENPEEFEKLASTLNESNRIWAQTAPLLVLTIAKLDSDVTRQLNRSAFYDLGGAVANLSIQAVAMGLSVHQIGGFNALKARELFDIPENFEPVTILAIGVRGSVESLPEALMLREIGPRKRRTLAEIIFKGKFGKPAYFDKAESEVLKAEETKK